MYRHDCVYDDGADVKVPTGGVLGTTILAASSANRGVHDGSCSPPAPAGWSRGPLSRAGESADPHARPWLRTLRARGPPPPRAGTPADTRPWHPIPRARGPPSPAGTSAGPPRSRLPRMLRGAWSFRPPSSRLTRRRRRSPRSAGSWTAGWPAARGSRPGTAAAR